MINYSGQSVETATANLVREARAFATTGKYGELHHAARELREAEIAAEAIRRERVRVAATSDAQFLAWTAALATTEVTL